MKNKEYDNRESWIAVAIDPSISENQLRIFMLIISKYMCDGALVGQAIYLPQRQSAEHLGISLDEYTSEINTLNRRSLITVDSNLTDYVWLH